MKNHLFRRVVASLLIPVQVFVYSAPGFGAANEAIIKAATAAGTTPRAVGFSPTAISNAIEEMRLGTPIKIHGNHEMAGSLLVPSYKAGNLAGGLILERSAKGQNPVTMIRKAFEATKAAGKSVAETTPGKFVISFPAEALLFFVALGAMSKVQLWSDYADNPVSWLQHLMAHDPSTPEGQLGYVGIAAFMATSRTTESLLYKMVGQSQGRGKYLLPLIPYAGMSLGLFASTIVHEVANFPQLKACTETLEKRVEDEKKWESCERAYDDFWEMGYEKMQQLTPTLISMVVSTVIPTYTVELVARNILAVRGFEWIYDHRIELGSFFTPAGFAAKTVRFLYRVPQFMGQTWLQFKIEPTITNWVKNIWDGTDLRRIETDLMYQIDKKKKNNWSEQPVNRQHGDLHLSVAKFSQHAKDWRKGNLLQQTFKYQHWMHFLNNFSQMYLASLQFYDHYINQYRNRYVLAKNSLIDEKYFLSGVTPLVKEGDSLQGELFNKPDYEKHQFDQLAAIRAYYESDEQSAELEKLHPEVAKEFKELVAMLPTAEDVKLLESNTPFYLKKVSTAMNLLNKKLGIQLDMGIRLSKFSQAEASAKMQAIQSEIEKIGADQDLSKEDKDEKIAELTEKGYQVQNEEQDNLHDFSDARRLKLLELRRNIGNPKPIEINGLGYLKAYENQYDEDGSLTMLSYPKTEFITDKKNNSAVNKAYSIANAGLQMLGFADEHAPTWTSKSNTLVYHHPIHYLAGQMVFGPRADLKEPLIKVSRSGFPAHFTPPRLVPSFTYDVLFQQTNKQSGDSKATIFNTPVTANGSNAYSYQNVYEIILAKNILPGVIDHKDGFMGWWKQHVVSQYVEAWKKFEDEYQQIMVEIIEQYNYHYKGTLSWDDIKRSGMSANAPLSNGIRLSLHQERRFHLFVLGEILKDHADKLPADLALLKLGRENPAIIDTGRSVKAFDVDALNMKHKSRCRMLKWQSQEECEKDKFLKDGYNQTSFIPILDLLKYQENYSLAKIQKHYNVPAMIPFKDKFEDRHFEFQDKIDLIIQNLEWYLQQMKVQEVISKKEIMQTSDGPQEFETTKKIIVSTVTNKQLRDMQNKVDALTKDYEKQFVEALGQVNPHVLKTIQASFRGLRSLAQQTAEIGRMVNAVSYEKSDEKERAQTGDICDTNSFGASKIGPMGKSQQRFEKKACKTAEAQPGNNSSNGT